MPSTPIRALLPETRVFPPSPEFAAQANVRAGEHARAAADPVGWWEEQARRLQWARPWDVAHRFVPALRPDGSLAPPEIAWFEGGRLNVAVNCVDRHVDAGLGEKVAFHFEGEPGDRRSLTYAQLQREVAKAANALEGLGVGPGDRVVVYLPVLLETVVATLAIARIGAVHSLVFGGFSAEALRFRVADTGAKAVVTTDGQFRRDRAVPVKAAVDEAVAGLDHVEHVLVVRRTGDDVPMRTGRDVWWHDVVDRAADRHAARDFDAEHPLFVIYTSGTTGRPKGVVHTSGGYLVQASWSHWAVFDAKPDDVHWCTADLAWVTAHTYALYGPLSNGVTSVLYEGTPDSPTRTRHLEVIERYGVTVYYTAPTLIRTLATWFPDGPPAGFDLSSVRLLGTVGEAINPAAWLWFREHLGAGRAPVVDTWWQSETGAAIAAPLPGVTPLKPGSATRALPGLRVRVVDEDGEDAAADEGGLLVIDGTWPAMARTLWRDPQRFLDAYWARFADRGYYVAGDGARLDADGDLVVLGRIDEVINVSGHRLSTIEIESALVAHPSVGEAAATGVADALTGEAIEAFVIPAAGGDELEAVLRAHVASAIGPIARPRRVHVVQDLPKTRSGKILRRLLRDLAEGRPLGDTTSLQDPDGPARIAAQLAAERAGAGAGRGRGRAGASTDGAAGIGGAASALLVSGPRTCPPQHREREHMPPTASDRRATTEAPIEEVLAMRWSPRAFDPEAVLPAAQLTSLLEAARWASSAENSQPARFVAGRRGTATFDRIERHLMGFNRAWAPNASALVLALVSTEDAEGRPLRWADYDTGQAMANLAVQAHALGLHVHPMGGIEVEALQQEFDLPSTLVPITVTAVGSVDAPDALPQRTRERETAPRARRPLSEVVLLRE